MEWLEQEAIATAPQHCKPRLWKHYVDGGARNDKERGSRKFDKTSWSNWSHRLHKIHVWRRGGWQHTVPRYRNLQKTRRLSEIIHLQKSNAHQPVFAIPIHHLLHQKLGVVRTWLDRKDNIVTEDPDKENEHVIREALSNCGYPKWAIDKVKETNTKDKIEIHQERGKKQGTCRHPIHRGLTERLSRVYKKHGFSTAMKPYITLCRMLVYPKDKWDPLQTADSVYEIPCKSCSKTYIGETGRIFKLDFQNTKKKQKNKVPKISPDHKGKHHLLRLSNRP